jgi:hypothetical protein
LAAATRGESTSSLSYLNPNVILDFDLKLSILGKATSGHEEFAATLIACWSYACRRDARGPIYHHTVSPYVTTEDFPTAGQGLPPPTRTPLSFVAPTVNYDLIFSLVINGKKNIFLRLTVHLQMWIHLVLVTH